ncbi:F-box protein [Abeliophyllum distichum]|uniref:F-box protein n=1 Tax=Abeliophyllum distichum TaxID=126358 RepID=A0ABD1SA45_9LAMI
MGKVSLYERESRNGRHKRRLRNANKKYLKPGALGQLRYSKASAAKSCTDIGKKRVALLNAEQTGNDDAEICQNESVDESPTISSPVRFGSASVSGATDVSGQDNLQNTPKSTPMFRQNKLHSTPKTPFAEEYESESRLESLPNDLLVNIICFLHHDQLRAVFHVSQKLRKAVIFARQSHFNYTTPDRARQELLKLMTPRPIDHWPFVSKRDGKSRLISSPHTPKAPKHGARPPRGMKITEMRQIAAVLFQDTSFPSACLVPSVLPKPLCRSLASNRVLFSEDELCQAVAQNKLL